MSENPETELEFRRMHIRTLIRSGFTVLDDVLEQVEADAEDDGMKAQLRAMVEEEAAAQLREQANWPAVTDCDRLDDVFARLEERGIVCRQDFTCCGTCGAYEIGAEMEAAEKDGVTVRGYAFFHQQDTENAVENHGLYLNYGSTSGTSDASVDIGKEIEAELRASGFDPKWNRRIETRIFFPIEWRRRFQVEAPDNKSIGFKIR